MTDFRQLAALLRTYQLKLLKSNRGEDRDTVIVSNTEAAIHLAEAAASVDKAIKLLGPFPVNDDNGKKTPVSTRNIRTGQPASAPLPTSIDSWNAAKT